MFSMSGSKFNSINVVNVQELNMCQFYTTHSNQTDVSAAVSVINFVINVQELSL